jgi:hypothetical protein
MSADETIALMRDAAPPASTVVLERIRATTADEIAALVGALGFSTHQSATVGDAWNGFRENEEWSSLLASLVTMVEMQRGHIDATIPIWDDLDDAGLWGQLLYFYLFALCAPGTMDFLRGAACPANVIDSTLSMLLQLSRLHEKKWRSFGVETGWWLLPILRGELIQVGSLWFHRVNLGVGNLSPDPWFDEEEAAALGVGFRPGDPSIGIHIPQDAALDPTSLDATFDEARHVIATMWPVSSRRLATCQTWMLDPQLTSYLAHDSNVLAFQRRFNVVSTWAPTWADGDSSIVEFVFRSPGVALVELPRGTTLERAVHDHIERGGHWFVQPGWLDFDGV